MTKTDYINYRVAKSQEVFADAQLLANEGRWNSCINRLYYSSFYLINALLLKTDIKSSTHNGTKSQFFLYYVKTGMVPGEMGKLYSDLFDWRQESDYADFVEFVAEIVIPMLDQVAEFNKIITKLISTD